MTEYAWHDLGDGRQVFRRVSEPTSARSDLACPMVISDHMPPTQSMADGRIYESKRGISAATKAAGCIEIGNEKMPPRQKQKPDRQSIKNSIDKARARLGYGA
jgi:hypothetical protein